MVAQVGYSVVGRSRGRVTSCAFCTVHVETRSVGFLVKPQKSSSTVCQWFDLKTTGMICQWFDLKINGTICQWFDLKIIGTVFSGLTSKPVVMVFSGLTSKSMAMVSPDLASKLVATVSPNLTSKSMATISLVLASKSVVEGFLVWVSKPAVRFGDLASKSSRRFLGMCLKIKRVSICRLRHKTDGRMKTTRGTCRDLAGCFVWM
jgi:hypothetical protein